METKTTVICYQCEIDKIMGFIYNRYGEQDKGLLKIVEITD